MEFPQQLDRFFPSHASGHGKIHDHQVEGISRFEGLPVLHESFLAVERARLGYSEAKAAAGVFSGKVRIEDMVVFEISLTADQP